MMEQAWLMLIELTMRYLLELLKQIT